MVKRMAATVSAKGASSVNLLFGDLWECLAKAMALALQSPD